MRTWRKRKIPVPITNKAYEYVQKKNERRKIELKDNILKSFLFLHRIFIVPIKNNSKSPTIMVPSY